MISICVTLKNRSRVKVNNQELLLFPNCVQSIIDSATSDASCELVVTDWKSDDWPLEEWLNGISSQLPINIVEVEGSFNRGKGRNLAANSAKGEYIFFLDADCLISTDVLINGVRALSQGKAYFPVLYSFFDASHEDGWWRHEGYGNCMVSKEMFSAIGGWPEYETWGKKDDDFYNRAASRYEIERNEVAGFYRQWHPNDIVWKNKFSSKASEIALEFERMESFANQLAESVSEGQTIILVDDTLLGDVNLKKSVTFLPFTESNGVYGGPPSDDQAAIQEFERLRKKGASYLAIAWYSFWWLDYYKEWHQYLRSSYPCVLENERVVVFDLRQSLIQVRNSASQIAAEQI